MSKILFLDTETTGTDSFNNEIVEIACQYYEKGRLISTFHTKMPVSWEKEINLGALKVNRHDLQASDVPDRKKAAIHLVKYLTQLPGDRNNPISIGGHNVAFDVMAIKKFLKGYGFVGWDELFAYRVKDSSTVAEFLREAGVLMIERMSLGSLAKALEIPVDSSKTHGAEYDTELSAKCYFKMLEMTKEMEQNAHNYEVICSLEEKDVHGQSK